jgi:hypothetical protein
MLSLTKTYLFQQSSLLDDIRDCLHLDAFLLVDVFEGKECFRMLVLDHTDLSSVMIPIIAARSPFQTPLSRHYVAGRSETG